MMIRTLPLFKMAKNLTSGASCRLQQLQGCLSHSNDVKSTVSMSTTSSAGPVGLASRHLAKGDKLPPKTDDSLRLFNMKYCPYALRARLVLAAKGVQYEIVNCNLKEKPEFLLERNPKGLVPVLEYKGHVVYESLIVSDLVDDWFPGRPLYPTDPFSKAKDKLLIQFFDGTLTNLMRKVMKFRENVYPDLAVQFMESLQKMENDLKARGTTYYSGSKPGMVDYMCWPWFERLAWNQTGDLLANFPTLRAYIKHMQEDDAVKAVHIPPEEVTRFYHGLFTGNVAYDL